MVSRHAALELSTPNEPVPVPRRLRPQTRQEQRGYFYLAFTESIHYKSTARLRRVDLQGPCAGLLLMRDKVPSSSDAQRG
eukprot:2365620-Rhodomonas_salina.3